MKPEASLQNIPTTTGLPAKGANTMYIRIHIFLFICALLCCTSIAQADGIDPSRPLWLRYPAVSPDGSRIAFSHSGQIWVVPTAGGQALSYTNPEFYSSYPVWSPDGRHLVFASKRHGNFDLFAVPADGGGAAADLAFKR